MYPIKHFIYNKYNIQIDTVSSFESNLTNIFISSWHSKGKNWTCPLKATPIDKLFKSKIKENF